ncbi:hypothetical protein ABZX92_30345 [Lentzea sp. NPDC006480]|uniref:hypothetical protein n=1 Tax=Lentzea sp. NPDC006480 TaxID=3157176 RepID=UPI0033B03C9D
MTRTELENQTPAAARLRTSWALAAAGGVLAAAGPLIGVVDGAEPAYTSWPLLAALALLPPAVAGVLLFRGRPFVAAGLIAAVGVFAVGRLLSDLQIAFAPMSVARPELFRPTTLIAVTPSAGLWLLIAGHVLVISAGVLSSGRAGMPADESESARFMGFPLLVAVVAAVGLLGKPFLSSDAFQLDRSPWDLPALGLTGGLVLALAAPLATALATSSPDPDTRDGGTYGVTLALLAVVVPWLAAGTVAPGLSITSGSVLVLIAALVLPAVPLLAWLVRLVLRRRDGAIDHALPSVRRLHVGAGVLALLSAVTVIIGALLPQLVLATGDAAPGLSSMNILWPAAVAVAVLGLLLLVPSTAATVRPAVVGAYFAMQLAAASATEPVVAANQAGLAQPGAGFWVLIAELPIGLLALVFVGLAGAVDRENTDRRESTDRKKEQLPLAELGALLLAGLFGLGAFALPTMRGADYTAPTLVPDGHPAVSWALLTSSFLLIMGLLVAVRSRPARGAAELVGLALLLGVRALELPLTGGRVEGAVAAPGTWLALASVAALLVAAGLMATRATR